MQVPSTRCAALQSRVGMSGAWLAPLVVSLTAAAYCHADPALISPNQSLAVESGREVTTAAPSEAPASAGDLVTPPAALGTVDSSRQGRGGAVIVRRHALEDGAMTAVRPIPWYRSSVGALAIVLVLIAAMFYFLRGYARRNRWSEPGKVMPVLARTVLDSRHFLTLVQVGRRLLVLGVSPDKVSILSEITDPCEALEIAAQAGAQFNVLPDFDTVLGHATRQHDGDKAEDKHQDDELHRVRMPSSSALRGLLKRLRTDGAKIA